MKWGGCVEGEGAQFVGPSNANDKMAGRINCVAQAKTHFVAGAAETETEIEMQRARKRKKKEVPRVK